LDGKVDKLLEEREKRTAREMNQQQLQKTIGASTIEASEFTINKKIILGSGASATVFAGRYQGADAAVKIFPLTNMSVEEQSKRKKGMAKEVQVMKTLNESPRIIRMFGWCELPETQQLLLLMERAVGGTVAALLGDKRRLLSDGQKALIIYQTSLGMKYLYSKGVMHRDLKAVNLLLNEKGEVKVSDFGISFAPSTQTSTKTTSGASAGTAPWMAPELFGVPPAPFAEACDVYSFGIVMGEVMTRNTTPYPGLQQVQVDSGRDSGREKARLAAARGAGE
jgi:serine/threonine protein kinase